MHPNITTHLFGRELGIHASSREVIRIGMALELKRALSLEASIADYTRAIADCHANEVSMFGSSKIVPQQVFSTELSQNAQRAVIKWITKHWLPSVSSSDYGVDHDFIDKVVKQLAGANGPQGAVCSDQSHLIELAKLRGRAPVCYEALELKTRVNRVAARTQLAANPDLPPALVTQLSALTEHAEVRAAAAGNPALSQKTALWLAENDPNVGVLMSIARTHAAHSEEIKAALGRRDNAQVNFLLSQAQKQRMGQSTGINMPSLGQPLARGPIPWDWAVQYFPGGVGPSNQEQPPRE